MATFFNQATLSYSGGTVNSNVTSGELVGSLIMTKTATVDEYSQGSQVTYILNIINTGNTSYNGLTLTDTLGEYPFDGTTLVPLDYIDGSVTYFINGALQPDPTVTTANGVVISPISVPAGGIATIAYTATANIFAPPIESGSIVNTAFLTGNSINISATETVNATQLPELGITKSLSPTIVTDNDQVTYTFVIQNTGNTEATEEDNVVITDTFSPVLSSLAVTYNGTPWTEGVQYSYDETTGLFQTLDGQITVPAATYTQDTETGEWSVTPGTSILTITGNI